MKKMMSILTLALVAMMILGIAVSAHAEDDQILSGDFVYEDTAPDTEWSAPRQPEQGGNGSASASQTGSAPAPVPDPQWIAPPAPKPDFDYATEGGTQYAEAYRGQSDETVEFVDGEVPLSSGLSPLQVEIFSDCDTLQFGQIVTLNSKVTANADAILAYQWQIDKGTGWKDIKDANNMFYTFVYTEKKMGYSWRLVVSDLNA